MNNYLALSAKLTILSATLLAAGCGGGGGGGDSTGTGTPAGTNPAPVVPSTVSGVAAAKKMFSSLRTNLQAWSDSTKAGGQLTVQYDAVRADFEKAGAAPLDGELLTWIQMSANAVDYFNRYKAGSTAVNPLSMSYASSARGSCTVYSDAAATVKATSPANALTVGCFADRVGGSVASNNTTITNVLLGSEMVLTPIAGTIPSFKYTARATRATSVFTFSNGTSVTSAKTTVGSYGSSDRASGTLAYSKAGSNLSSLAINGMMPARMTNRGIAVTDYELWNINVARAAEANGVFNYALSGELASWLGGAAVGKVTLADGSFARMLDDQHDRIDDLLKEVKLTVAAEAGRSKITGVIQLESFSADKNGQDYSPNKTAFTGKVSNNGVEFFSGSLGYDRSGYALFNSNLALSATNTFTNTTSLAGTFTVSARPPLVLSATIIDQSPIKVTESAQYNDGTVVVNASRVSSGSAAAAINLASADGVTVALTGADTSDVMKDGIKVAVVNIKTGVINYVDGTFESLK